MVGELAVLYQRFQRDGQTVKGTDSDWDWGLGGGSTQRGSVC
jgi:hypothetical protein